MTDRSGEDWPSDGFLIWTGVTATCLGILFLVMALVWPT